MPEITDDNLAQALPKIEKPLKKYLWLQERAKLANPEDDDEFCRKFSGFYRVRRGADWRRAYFSLLGEMRDGHADFRTCLTRLYDKTGRVEASFTSKLVATLDPTLPVLDSVVLRHLHLKLPVWNDTDRLKQSAAIYQNLIDKMTEIIDSLAGKRVIAAFRQYSNDFRNAGITDMKIVDLIFWQIR
jgi:hypothetical protein